jgi:hypothetical protein
VWLPDEGTDPSRLAIEDVEGMVAEVVPLPDRSAVPSPARGVAHAGGRRSGEA